MAKNKAYLIAEKKIAEALRTGATELDLSRIWYAKDTWYLGDSERLTELPESLGQLTQLRLLNLRENQLTSLPESLGKLTKLQSLDLSTNRLTSLQSRSVG
ncbi:leucine-rich repeat domain-containing protein [Chlorobaculum limnaeum]|uniref:leucine-rich repeat domain-containing protein n=1 Tax=Chlorobaculum limnaeum TaxID=274537 RepID=UPI000A3DE79A